MSTVRKDGAVIGKDGRPYAYACKACGWRRIILDGETVEDARRAHEGADIHRLDQQERHKHERQ